MDSESAHCEFHKRATGIGLEAEIEVALVSIKYEGRRQQKPHGFELTDIFALFQTQTRDGKKCGYLFSS